MNGAAAGRRAKKTARPLRGILVGCGFISTQQLDAWNRIPDAEIIALVDTDEAKSKVRSQEYGIAPTYTDLAAALKAHDVDFVDIATPPRSHLELVRIAASSGVHVLCQKPFAPTMAEVDEMNNIARVAGVQLIANENMRFQPWYRKMKELMALDSIGRPFNAHWNCKLRATLPSVRFVDQPYFAEMPRLVIYEMGVHFFDTMRYLFGEPHQLSAVTGRNSRRIAGEDSAVVLVTYESLVVVIDISWASVPVHDTEASVGWSEMTVEGEGGTMHLSNGGLLRVLTDSDEKQYQFGPDTVDRGFEEMQRCFIECIADGDACEVSGSEYAKSMELVFGSYASAAKQQAYRVSIDRSSLR